MCHSTVNTIRLPFVHICIIKIRKLKKNFQLTALLIVYHCQRSHPFAAVARGAVELFMTSLFISQRKDESYAFEHCNIRHSPQSDGLNDADLHSPSAILIS